MAAITNPPRGLISIFGLNDFGKVPNDLTQSIVGTFDISELCLLNRELIVGNVNTGPGIGGISITSVPPGELWFVWTFSVRTGAIPAGESLRFTVGYLQNNAYLVGSPARSGTAGEQVGNYVQGPFWVGPGAGLGMGVEQETGAAKTLTWQAVIVRLRI